MKKGKFDKVICVIIGFLWNIFLFSQKPFYEITPDSFTYQIKDLSALIDGHRLPLYKIINWFFYILCGKNYEYASIAVVIFQTLISIFSSVLIYECLDIVIKKRRINVLLTIIYAVIVGAFGYNEHILTESLAISFMTLLIWLIVKAISSEKKIYFILLPVVSLFSVLLRPSFIFLFPLLGMFLVIYFIYHRKTALYGLISLLLALSLILGICFIHKDKYGLFCLSDVSYQNEMGIIVSNGYYNCDEYEVMSDYIERNIINSESEDKCCYFSDVSSIFGFDKTIEYMKACKKEHLIQMIRDSVEYTLYPYSDAFIIRTNSTLNLKMQILFGAIIVSIFPFTYGGLLFITVVFLIDTIVRSYKEQKIKYIELGLIGCIWCIYILTFLTLYEASAQRIAVHIIPCVVVIAGLIIERVTSVISVEK